MSGWTILTVRATENSEYDRTHWDDTGRGRAQYDIVATMEEDGRVNEWKTGTRGHVYAYLNCSRYNFEFAEELLEDYGDMVEDAVVLGENDTTDTGMARYYERPDLGKWIDQYEESQSLDGTFVGEMAMATINSRHGILSKDPWHDKTGWYDDHVEDGFVNEEALP